MSGNGRTASVRTCDLLDGNVKLSLHFVIARGNASSNVRATLNQNGGTFTSNRCMELDAGAEGWGASTSPAGS